MKLLPLMLAAAADSLKCTAALEALNAHAALYGFSKPRQLFSKPRSLAERRMLVIDACTDYVRNPQQRTYNRAYRALHAHAPDLLHAIDKRQSKPFRYVQGFDKAAPQPREVPAAMLSWQTSPAIGVNPALVAMLRQHVQPEPIPRDHDISSSRYKALYKYVPTLPLVPQHKHAARVKALAKA